MPTNGFSTKPLKVKLLAGEQKAAEEGDAAPWASSCAPGKALVRLQLRSSVPYKPGDHLAVVPRNQQFAGVALTAIGQRIFRLNFTFWGIKGV